MIIVDYVTDFSFLLALSGIINSIGMLIWGRNDKGIGKLIYIAIAYAGFIVSSAFAVNYAINIIIIHIKP